MNGHIGLSLCVLYRLLSLLMGQFPIHTWQVDNVKSFPFYQIFYK